jgi:hypothetical protein
MPIRTYSEYGSSAFLSEAKSERHLPWCFIHIPKTAGVSFAQEAREKFRYKNVFLTNSDYEAIQSGQQSFTDALKVRLESLRGEILAGKFNFISGHLHYYNSYETLKSFGPIRLMTFLRHPVDRVVSDYRYCMSPAFPAYLQFRQRYPDIENYLAEKSESNKIYKYLCRNVTEPAIETARRTEESFAFVGLVEDYEYFRALFWLMNGIAAPAQKRLNITENSERPQVSFTELRERIAAANEHDMTIYSYFNERLSRVPKDPAAIAGDGIR